MTQNYDAHLPALRPIVVVDDVCVRTPPDNPIISLGYEGRDAADLIVQL